VTGGSRVTFATGMAVVEASKKVVDELRGRAAMIWDVDVEGVIWEDGHAKPASSNVGDFQPMSFKEIAAKKALTGGPITAAASVNAGGMAPGFSTQFCDVEVDPETGKVTILRFVAAQDVGCAIHPSYVEGQIQGGRRAGHRLGAQRGVHIRSQRPARQCRLPRLPGAGRLRHADDRADPGRGAEPGPPLRRQRCRRSQHRAPMAAIANAIDSAINRRLTELPMSPPRIRAALDTGQADD
jgi:CO/xanthine dehydrogenase Mo-binding subunit